MLIYALFFSTKIRESTLTKLRDWLLCKFQPEVELMMNFHMFNILMLMQVVEKA